MNDSYLSVARLYTVGEGSIDEPAMIMSTDTKLGPRPLHAQAANDNVRRRACCGQAIICLAGVLIYRCVN